MRFLSRCIGVDLGATSVKVAELALASDGIHVLKLASAGIDVPVDAPMSEQRAAALRALREVLKANKITTKEAVFCVPGQTVFVRRFRLPKTSEERLARIIQYEARQQIPYPIEKTMLEYQVFEVEEVPEVDVFLVALKKDVLFDFMDIINRTGLKPIGISVSSLALYNFYSLDALPTDKLLHKIEEKKQKFPLKLKTPKLRLRKKAKPTPEEGGEPSATSAAALEGAEEFAVPEMVRAYVNIGASVTDLSIGSVGKAPALGFTRSVPLGGNAITNAILEKCGDVGDYARADRVKEEKTVILTMDYAEGAPKAHHRWEERAGGRDIDKTASEAATAVVDKIIAELRRSLDFYISQPEGMAVDEIILSGGQSQIPNIAPYIEDKLGVPVRTLESPSGENFKELQKVDKVLGLYPISIGLGVTGLGIAHLLIDFLPPDRKVAIRFKRKRAFVLILAAMAAGTIIIGAMSGNRYISVYREQTERYQDQIDRYRPMINRVKAATTEQGDLKKKFDLLAKGLTAQRDYPLRIWHNILTSKPADVLVSSLKIFPDGRVQIEGYTEDMGSAVNFTANLNSDLKDKLETEGAKLKDIRPEFHDLFKKKVSKFTINMKFKGRRSRIEQAVVQPTFEGRRTIQAEDLRR